MYDISLKHSWLSFYVASVVKFFATYWTDSELMQITLLYKEQVLFQVSQGRLVRDFADKVREYVRLCQ